jgi:hypothetical protein
MRLRLLAPPCLAALVLAPSVGALMKFYGTVGPGTTIVLKRADGTVVKNTRHRNNTFVIRDKSSFNNFQLYGPGIDRHTGVAFVGKRPGQASACRSASTPSCATVIRSRCLEHFDVFQPARAS